MAQVPALSFYLGPFAVYTSPTGMTDPTTGIPYLGGTLHEGDYVDATLDEIRQWNVRFGSNLNTGRFRLVRLSPRATAANTGYGVPLGWGLAQTVARVVLSAAGSGATSDGTYTIASASSATGDKATALATVASGAITAVQLTYPGSGFTSVPTFGLTEIAGLSGGSVLAQMANSPNFVSTFDSSSVDLTDVRAICLSSVTAAQITANAWIVVQELGIADVLVTTASGTPAAGNGVTAATGGAVTSNSTITNTTGFIGYALDLPAASTHIRVNLRLPVEQG